MRKKYKRVLALFLSLIMTITLGLGDASAYYVDDSVGSLRTGITIKDKDGIEVTPDTTWNSTFPYGTFAFEYGDVTAAEGGKAQKVKVYRLGGLKGKATAYITYMPAIVEDDKGETTYSYAVSSSDVTILVEDPLPITEYQAVGKDPEPEETVEMLTAVKGTDEGGNSIYDISIGVAAEAYRWYTLNNGVWKPISGAEGSSILVNPDDYSKFDFRCVYTLSGVSYCTDSIKGVAYEKPEEIVLPEAPEDLELNPETTYSELELANGEPYAGWVFEMTFAEGEYVKEIIFEAIDDVESEYDEYSTLTIQDCEGGTVYDSANTLLLHITDNDEDTGLPIEVGFEVSEVTFDKADGTAYLTIRRTGNLNKVLTLKYATIDGTAAAGRDYAAASGNIAFYADYDTYTIEVDLINDSIENGELKYFTVKLSSLLGDNTATLTTDTILVWLYNSASSDTLNAASVLYDAEAIDVSDSVIMSDSAANSGTKTITGAQEDTSSEILGEIIWEDSSDLSTQSYDYGKINFGANMKTSNIWTSSVNVLNMGWSGGTTVLSKGVASSTLQIDPMAILYSSFSGSFSWDCSLGSDTTLFAYGLEYTYPYFKILTNTGAQHAYADSGCTSSGNWFSGYSISWWTGGSCNTSWNMNSGVNRLVLGTQRYDAHNSKDNAKAQLTSGSLSRRYFSNPKAFGLKINTANDSDSAIDKSAVYNNKYYSNLNTNVTIADGGTNYNGCVFVGSTLKVSLGTSASLTAPSIDDTTYAVYLTDDSTGNVVAGSTKSGSDYYITLNWGTGTNLSGSYTINVVMVRKQTLTVNLFTSADSELSATEGNTAANNLFIASNNNRGITLGYTAVSKATNNGKNIARLNNTITEGTIQVSDFTFSDSAGKLEMLSSHNKMYENMQYINFNLSPDDIIIINGNSYSGDENIWLTNSDLISGNLTFYYYHKDYQSKQSTMIATIDHVALYYDSNGNGRIDGYWDEQDGFTLDVGSGDIFVTNLKGNNYEETFFEPVVDDDGTVHQYFMKVYYTMNARCLTVPEGSSAGDYCQVMPSFITSITDPAAYSALTKEQKSYRYIVSGTTKNSAEAGYNYSSDNHLMYTADAMKTSYVDIPLGGDKNPCKVNTAGDGYEWNPEYYGNLLYKFEYPEPIYIKNSLAGSNIPIASGVEFNSITGKADLDQYDIESLNNYLGSFGGNDTFALVIQEQERTTGDILNGLSLLEDEDKGKESINLGTVFSFPNSEYLQDMNGTTENSGVNDSGKNDYSEFSSSYGTSLASFDFEIGDYFALSTDEYEVSFSIGIPLGGYENKTTNSSSDNGWSGPKDKNIGNLNDAIEGVEKVKDFIKNKDKSFLAGDELDSSKLKAGSFEVSFSASIGFVFKYNSLDNSYYFSEAAISFTASLEYRYQYRFTPVPIVYVYVQVGVEATISTGLGVNREAVEGDVILQNNDTTLHYIKNETTGAVSADSYKFSTDKKAFNITFSGKVYLEAFSDEACTTKLDGFTAGTLSSDGSFETQVILVGQDDMDLSAPAWVIITAMKDTTISRIAKINGIYSDVYWSGFSVDIEAYVEAGAGVGVEIAKFEIYAKIVIGIGFTLGAYDQNTHTYSAGSFDEFSFQLGLGFRVVLLFFSYEMDLIEYHVKYDGEEDKWSHGYSAFGGAYGSDTDINSLAFGDEDDSIEVTVTMPGNNTFRQTFYSNGVTGGIEQQSVSTDTYFDVSGYGSSSSGFKLFDGVTIGYDYQVVTIGNDNYLVYTISTSVDDSENALKPEDYTTLVLSKIKLTSTDGNLAYGLVNPVDESNTATPYIKIDNDYTGDLDFSAWADGNIIRVSWVSYKTQTSEPVKSDYYSTITVEAYNVLDESEKSNYTPDNETTPTEYYAPVAPYGSYAEALTAYNSDVSDFSNPKKRASNAAKNTEIKIAGFDTADSLASGFTSQQVISGNVTSISGSGYTFLPYGKSNVTVFGQTAEYYLDSELQTELDTYESYLTDAGYNPDISKYRMLYKEAEYYTFGKRSNLNIAYYYDLTNDGIDNPTWNVSSIAMTSGQKLTNSEFTEIDGTCYLAYTTEQSTYDEGKNDWCTVSRLYLRTMMISGGTVTWGSPKLLRTLYNYDRGNMLDGIYSSTTLIDEYEDPYFSSIKFLQAKLGDSLVGTPETFTTLSDVPEETFLLFEMNGSTYVIDEDSLKSITASGIGTIYPFFTPQSLATDIGTGATEPQSSSGKTEVTIGADGDGNIAAVYVSTVKNTTNNALYLSYYDAETGKWGDGVMLAMMYMDIYEAAAANSWDNETTEAAYYDDSLGGGMAQFVFSNIQIALGTKGSTDPLSLDTMGNDGMASDFSSAPPQALVNLYGEDGPGELETLSDEGKTIFEELGIDTLGSTSTTLLIITQGTYTELEEYYITDGSGNKIQNEDGSYQTMVTAKKGYDSNVGIYAVSYGYGGQEVGEISLSFPYAEFTAGTKLFANLEFKNTGDSAIRYSKAGDTEYPINVNLYVHTGASDQHLASWKITENIKSGQKVSNSGYLNELNNDLAAGDYFYITLSEDAAYFGDSYYNYSSKDAMTISNNIYVVEDKPELGFESFDAKLVNVNSNGTVTLNVDFQVSNRGSKTAEDVYVQFTYDTGKIDSNGEAVYSVLDITNSDLTVSAQELLETMEMSTNKSQGILMLYGTDGSDEIDPGYARTVKGTITVPPSVFSGAVSGSLNMKVEVYSKSSGIGTWSAGVISSGHEDEYDPVNNSKMVQLEHTSFIATATSLTIPLGSTLRLPVSVTTTTGNKPEITVYEVSDDNGVELGILYYDESSNAVIIMPSKTGNGVIHVTDAATNTTRAVTYTIGDPGDGMNVEFENKYFTFYEADGTTHGKEDDYTGWDFRDVPTWGEGIYISEPYMFDLAVGTEGAYFTFETQADEIDFYFSGNIQVAVKDAFGDAVTLTDKTGNVISGLLTASGGRSSEVLADDPTYKSIYFNNINQETYTVTVMTVNGTAYIDTISQYYSGVVPTPSDDIEAPGIYWNRIFPDTASIDKDDNAIVDMKVNIIDNSGLSSVTLNGETPTLTKYDNGMWAFTFHVDRNGNHTIKAVDQAGNTTSRTITVDWFADSPAVGSTSFAPDITAKLYKVSGSNKIELTDTTMITSEEFISGSYAMIEVGATQNVEYRVYYYDANTNSFSMISPESDGTFKAGSNGYYRVVATYTGSDLSDVKYGTWSSRVLYLKAYDTELPLVSLTEAASPASGSGINLSWSAVKKTGGTMVSASINGDTIYADSAGKVSLSGTYNVSYGSNYTLTVSDSSGNTVTSNVLTVEVPVDASDTDVLTTTSSWNQADNNGSIIIDFSKVTGGNNTNDGAIMPSDYYGSYDYSIVAAKDDYAGEDSGFADWLDTLHWTFASHSDIKTVSGLASGGYLIYIRDATDKSNINTVTKQAINVANEIVKIVSTSTRNASTEAPDSYDGTATVTASGSGTGTYQFAAKALTLKKKDMDNMDLQNEIPEFETTYTAKDFTNWQTSSWDDAEEITTFNGLSSGWYQIAVRTMYGVSEADIAELNTFAKNTYNAETALSEIDENIASNVRSSLAVLGQYYSNWRSAIGSVDETDAYNAYVAAVNNDTTILDYMNALRAAEDEAEEAYRLTGVVNKTLTAAADAAREAYNQATKSYFTDYYTASSGKAAKEAAYNTALAAYEAKLIELKNVAGAYYQDNSPYWDGVYTMSYVYVGYDSAVTFNLDKSDTTSLITPNGTITIKNASGGATGTYQFAVIPVTDKDGYTLAELQSMDIDWQVADSSNDFATATFKGLTSGTYQVIVRPMYAVTTEELSKLYSLETAMDAAEVSFEQARYKASAAGIAERVAEIAELYKEWQSAISTVNEASTEAAYKAAIGNDATVLDKLITWQSASAEVKKTAKADYDSAVEAYVKAQADIALVSEQSEYEKAYNAYHSRLVTLNSMAYNKYKTIPGYWNNSSSTLTYINLWVPSINSGILSSTSEDGMTTYILGAGAYLNPNDNYIIYSANQNGPVKLNTDNMEIIIPQGILTMGYDINKLIPDISNIENCNLVAYTDSSGVRHIVTLSLVKDGKAAFIVRELGEYFLTEEEAIYVDTAGHWAEDAISFVSVRGLFAGTGEGKFSPDLTMTRAMLVTVLHRLAGGAEAEGSNKFSDVANDAWYTDAVIWATESGIVFGYGDGKFGTNDKISRQDMVTILKRYMDYIGYDTSVKIDLSSFGDISEISGYARDSMSWAVSIGIISGTKKTELSPRDDASRAQVASIYMRLILYMLNSAN